MPIILDPAARFEVVLASDQDKPAEQRPTFEFRHLTVREWKRVAELSDRLVDAPSGSVALDHILEAVKVGLTGWRHMGGMAYDPERLPDLITLHEAKELMQALMAQGQPSGRDLGKSVSQP